MKISEHLFAGEIKDIPPHDLLAGLKNVPHFETTGGALVDVLVSSGICTSKREAREFLSNGALSLNGDVVKDPALEITSSLCIDGRYLGIRRGKKKYYVGELKG